MDDSDRIPTAEDAPLLMVVMRAADAPAAGARVSLDYVDGPGAAVGVTWFALNPDGAWVVESVDDLGEHQDGEPLVSVWLNNPSRPDLPT